MRVHRIELFDLLPRAVVNRLTLTNMGRLTAADTRLWDKEVPTITVQDLCEAIKAEDTSGPYRWRYRAITLLRRGLKHTPIPYKYVLDSTAWLERVVK